MKKNIRKTIASLIFILLTLQMHLIAFAEPNIPAATSDFYVNDFANVFSEEEKNGLMERAVGLANTSDGIQVVITTIRSLDGNTVEDYGYAMYKQYGIGKNDMGLLILLSTEDRKIRVEVGKNMEAYINDSKAGRFMDNYAIPKLKENKFNEGLISLQTELINEIKICINNSNTSTDSAEDHIVIDWGAVVFSLLVIAIFGFLGAIVFIIYKKSKRIKDLEDENTNLLSKIQVAKQEAATEIEQARRGCANILNQKEQLDKEYYNLESRFNTLSDRYKRGTILYPELDSRIDAMIEEEIRKNDMAKAASVDSIIKEVITLSASKESLKKFENALFAYNSLTTKQQSYVQSDIGTIRKLNQQSKELKNKHLAGIAVTTITSIISGITVAKEKHIRDLKEAKETYESLNSEVKKYVDSSIPTKISNLLSEALRDKKQREEREEEEERRRREAARRRSSYNSTSFGSSHRGGFGGFGGRPGGGGASRGF